jgi:AcrR family transcriptional regulator
MPPPNSGRGSVRILLRVSPADAQRAELDRSSAFAVAEQVIETWTDESEANPNDKAAHIRKVARTEFGRRGYEVTTIRDIASAAGLGIGTVYRLTGSKEELLASIMRSFEEKVGAGWVGVLQSDATPIEKLDALSWVDINALDRFHDEFRIQLAWMRQSPPDTPNPARSFCRPTAESVAIRRDQSGRYGTVPTEVLSRACRCPDARASFEPRGSVRRSFMLVTLCCVGSLTAAHQGGAA